MRIYLPKKGNYQSCKDDVNITFKGRLPNLKPITELLYDFLSMK